ncbi:hypothetical protein V7114_20555 [Neobacillus niacini]|uniref:hypothetical protein n=1 Tax=Neobacillus niacini TaxID=86668 RepID=UPI002FFEA1C3
MSIEMLLEYINTLNKLLNSPMNGKHRQVIEEKIFAVCEVIEARAGIKKLEGMKINNETTIQVDAKKIATVINNMIKQDERYRGY